MNQYEFTTDPTWPDWTNPAAKAQHAEAELSALRSRLRDLIERDGKRDGRVSCRLLRQALEAKS